MVVIVVLGTLQDTIVVGMIEGMVVVVVKFSSTPVPGPSTLGELGGAPGPGSSALGALWGWTVVVVIESFALYLGGQLFHFFQGGVCINLMVTALSITISSSSSPSLSVLPLMHSIRCAMILRFLSLIPGLRASAAIVTCLLSSGLIAGVALIAGWWLS